MMESVEVLQFLSNAYPKACQAAVFGLVFFNLNNDSSSSHVQYQPPYLELLHARGELVSFSRSPPYRSQVRVWIMCPNHHELDLAQDLFAAVSEKKIA